MIWVIFNSCPYTNLRSYNSIGICPYCPNRLSIRLRKISQCRTKHTYNHSYTSALVYFSFLIYFPNIWISNFVVTCSHMLIIYFIWFFSSYVYVVLVHQRLGGGVISLHTYFQVIQIKYRLDTNMFLGQVSKFPNIFLNLKYDFETYFETS